MFIKENSFEKKIFKRKNALSISMTILDGGLKRYRGITKLWEDTRKGHEVEKEES